MSNSAINTQVAQLKIGNVQNQADNSAVYSGGIWSLKNSTAVTSVTITDSGNVGIGVTPSAWSVIKAIEFAGGASFSADTSSNPFIASNSFFDGANWKYKNTSSAGNYYIAGNTHVWRISPSGTAGNTVTWTQAMTLDASGNLLAGGKTSSNILNVGAQLNANGSVWGTVSAAADCIASYTKTSLTSGILFSGYSDVGGTTATKLLIYSDGNVRIAAGSTYGNFSDIKFKENIVDATPKLDDVLKLQVRNFTIKNEGLKAIGFIAQEFEQVFPALVVTSPDRDYEGNDLGTESKAIKESALIPILVKSIQELSAKNDALEARLAALEAK